MTSASSFHSMPSSQMHSIASSPSSAHQIITHHNPFSLSSPPLASSSSTSSTSSSSSSTPSSSSASSASSLFDSWPINQVLLHLNQAYGLEFTRTQLEAVATSLEKQWISTGADLKMLDLSALELLQLPRPLARAILHANFSSSSSSPSASSSSISTPTHPPLLASTSLPPSSSSSASLPLYQTLVMSPVAQPISSPPKPLAHAFMPNSLPRVSTLPSSSTSAPLSSSSSSQTASATTVASAASAGGVHHVPPQAPANFFAPPVSTRPSLSFISSAAASSSSSSTSSSSFTSPTTSSPPSPHFFTPSLQNTLVGKQPPSASASALTASSVATSAPAAFPSQSSLLSSGVLNAPPPPPRPLTRSPVSSQPHSLRSSLTSSTASSASIFAATSSSTSSSSSPSLFPHASNSLPSNQPLEQLEPSHNASWDDRNPFAASSSLSFSNPFSSSSPTVPRATSSSSPFSTFNLSEMENESKSHDISFTYHTPSTSASLASSSSPSTVTSWRLSSAAENEHDRQQTATQTKEREEGGAEEEDAQGVDAHLSSVTQHLSIRASSPSTASASSPTSSTASSPHQDGNRSFSPPPSSLPFPLDSAFSSNFLSSSSSSSPADLLSPGIRPLRSPASTAVSASSLVALQQAVENSCSSAQKDEPSLLSLQKLLREACANSSSAITQNVLKEQLERVEQALASSRSSSTLSSSNFREMHDDFDADFSQHSAAPFVASSAPVSTIPSSFPPPAHSSSFSKAASAQASRNPFDVEEDEEKSFSDSFSDFSSHPLAFPTAVSSSASSSLAPSASASPVVSSSRPSLVAFSARSSLISSSAPIAQSSSPLSFSTSLTSASASTSPFCACCNSRHVSSRPYPLTSCGHVFNTSCLASFLEALVRSKKVSLIVCPLKGCGKEVQSGDVQAVLPRAVFDDYLQATFLAFLEQDGSSFYCPNTECKSIISIAPFVAPSSTAPITECDDDGKVLTREAYLHFCEFRVRCRECSFIFCASCKVTPYHKGFTCAQFAEYAAARHCRFCSKRLEATAASALLPSTSASVASTSTLRSLPAPVAAKSARSASASAAPSPALPSSAPTTTPLALRDVCRDAECVQRAARACIKMLPCGCPCGGVRDELECLPCLKHELEMDEEFCVICYVEELKAAPCVRLEAPCSHVFHAHCLEKRLESRWTGARISFDFLKCPACKQKMKLSNSSLSAKLEPLLALEKTVSEKALLRLQFEQRENEAPVSQKGGEFYGNPVGYALKSYLFFSCFKCEKPYFAGGYQCQESNEESVDYSELICPSCQPQSVEDCAVHGKDWLAYKCRYCCTYANWYCVAGDAWISRADGTSTQLSALCGVQEDEQEQEAEEDGVELEPVQEDPVAERGEEDTNQTLLEQDSEEQEATSFEVSSSSLTPSSSSAPSTSSSTPTSVSSPLALFDSDSDLDPDCCSTSLSPYSHSAFSSPSHLTLKQACSLPPFSTPSAAVSNSALLSFNESSSTVIANRLLRTYRRGRKACVELTFLDGRTLICTPEHELLSTRGWLKAERVMESGASCFITLDSVQDRRDEQREREFVLPLLPSLAHGETALSLGTELARSRSLACARLAGLCFALSKEDDAISDAFAPTALTPASASSSPLAPSSFASSSFFFDHARDREAFLRDQCLALDLAPESLAAPFTPAELMRAFPGLKSLNLAVFLSPACPHSLLREWLAAFLGAASAPIALASASSSSVCVLPAASSSGTPEPVALSSASHPFHLSLPNSRDAFFVPFVASRLGLPQGAWHLVEKDASFALDPTLLPLFSSSIGFRYHSEKLARLTVAAAFVQREASHERLIALATSSVLPSASLSAACADVTASEFVEELGATALFSSTQSLEHTLPSLTFTMRVISTRALHASRAVFDLSFASSPSFFANSVLVHNCWGNTHFCDRCHKSGVWQHLTVHRSGKNKKKLWEYENCPSLKVQIDAIVKESGLNEEQKSEKIGKLLANPKECPLGVRHPPAGFEFGLGCSMCEDSSTSRATLAENQAKVQEKLKRVKTEVKKFGAKGKSFTHSFDFDTQGIFYFLGTCAKSEPWVNPCESGFVRIISSGLMGDSAPLSAAVGRDLVRCVTTPVKNSWFCFELLDFAVELTAYTLKHYNSWDTEALRHWTLEGSNLGADKGGKSGVLADGPWETIIAHVNDTALAKKGATHTWKIAPTFPPRRYRCFRLIQNGRNSNNNYYLPCSGMEFYGTLFVAEDAAVAVASPSAASASAAISPSSSAASPPVSSALAAAQLARPPPLVALAAPRPHAGRIFTHSSDFDRAGIVYFMATRFGLSDTWQNPTELGLIRAFCSELNGGLPVTSPPSAILGRELVRCVSVNKPGQFFVVDFSPSGYRVRPSAYSLKHYSSWDLEALRNWRLEGAVLPPSASSSPVAYAPNPLEALPASSSPSPPVSVSSSPSAAASSSASLAQFSALAWTVLAEHVDDCSLDGKGSTHTWPLSQAHGEFNVFRLQMTGENSNKHHYLACSGFEIYGQLVDSNTPVLKQRAQLKPLFYSTAPATPSSSSAAPALSAIPPTSEQRQQQQQLLIVFKRQFDLDVNGLFYFLGTQGRRAPFRNPHELQLVTVSSSALADKPTPSAPAFALLSRALVRVVSAAKPAMYFAFDLRAHTMSLSEYTLQHYASFDTEALRNWRLEATNDATGMTWDCLREHVNDEALQQKGQAHSWSISPAPEPRFYRFFRVLQTGPNSNQNHYLALSGVEFYGTLKWNGAATLIPSAAPAIAAPAPALPASRPSVSLGNPAALPLPMSRPPSLSSAPSPSAMPSSNNATNPFADNYPMPHPPPSSPAAYLPALPAPVAQRLPTAQARSPRPFTPGMSFDYCFDLDEQGVLFYLGTRFGSAQWKNPVELGFVTVSSSTLATSPPCDDLSALVGRAACRLVTTSQKDAFFSLDLRSFCVLPTYYTLRHYNSYDSEALRDWKLQGSNDGIKWVKLSSHKKDESLFGIGKAHSWPIAAPSSVTANASSGGSTSFFPFSSSTTSSSSASSSLSAAPNGALNAADASKLGAYRMFRILQTGRNSNGHLYLALSSMEIYGKLFQFAE